VGWEQLGNLLSLCREIAGARDILLWIETAGKFVVAVQRNWWRTRYFTKIRKFEKTTRVKFQLMILHF
jgi:hypothetical protein